MGTGNRREFGVRNAPRYFKSRCFDPSPFSTATKQQKERILELAEHLDQHHKEQRERHEGLTITSLYSVMEKERVGKPLDEDKRRVHEQGLVGVLSELHHNVDRAMSVAQAVKECGDECEKHTDMHEHCRVCMESCRRYEESRVERSLISPLGF